MRHFRNSFQTFMISRHWVNGLRLFWTLLALWYERQVFIRSADRCSWPDTNFRGREDPTHVLLVADPQIVDHRSYPERSALLTYITQLLVDLNLRKSWRAALRLRPDIVIFLGDMMDNGRYAMSNGEYERYYARFKSIFPLDPSILSYWIPGNHDTGIGSSKHFSRKAKARYISHFGPLNSRATIAGHNIVLLDAPSLVEEEASGPRDGGTTHFVRSYLKSQEPNPVVLFTHIPLARPDGAQCGPSREHGSIRRGAGFGYQNTLGKTASNLLLQTYEPSVIFSGDDHDYCDYTHTYNAGGQSKRAREVTVKSLSMVMNVRKPGVQLLSLVPPSGAQGGPTHSDALCLFPDQLGIYLSIYIPLLLLSLLAILLANSYNSPRHSRSRKSDDLDALPRPSASTTSSSRTFVLFGRRRRVADFVARFLWPGENHKSRSFAARVLYDVRDVAVFPLGVFLGIALWTFR